MHRIRAFALLLALGLLAPLAPLYAQPAPDKSATTMARQALEIATAKGVLVFEVELADTDAQRAKGLMFRDTLGDRRGMLFDFKVDQPVAMWMRNTKIPLDMLFIRADGTIARIAAMTTPFSEQTISSGEPVRAVLEIDGGAARRLGITAGDKVAHPVFAPR
ncbi:DUF192 domain-containing protein [Xanthobacter tagetidis]|uniref:DUF192 domain-containing protein n=1 Tax=Xanthobacter tagetidis TaxID=60216 RepID=A0A3L7AL21_9HYPH|nr:DUF192 domain-containing protein [Xanthobacter tagetidis]MBB6307556.1 hypothetical protein [Xanthobacter tagetidis]RLP81129.1 DUF192 domain-containing protein [Xanthobacter tagetidis]